MIRNPVLQNEDEAKRHLKDVQSTLYLFGVMVVIIRLIPPVLRFVRIQ